MMRRFSMVALVNLACSSGSAQTRALIQRQYDRYAKAYVANDVQVMLSVLAPEYTLTDASGKRLNRSVYARQLRERKKAGKRSQAYTVEITALTVKARLLPR